MNLDRLVLGICVVFCLPSTQNQSVDQSSYFYHFCLSLANLFLIMLGILSGSFENEFTVMERSV